MGEEIIIANPKPKQIVANWEELVAHNISLIRKNKDRNTARQSIENINSLWRAVGIEKKIDVVDTNRNLMSTSDFLEKVIKPVRAELEKLM